MAVYRSKLETLEKLRTAARDEQLRRVADAIRAEAALADQMAAVHAEIEAAKQHQRSLRQDSPNVHALLETERYELLLKRQAADIERQQQAVSEERERRQQELAGAEQQLRVVEKIDDRRRRAYEQQQRRTEQALMDEIATRQFLGRRMTEQYQA